MDCSRSPLDRGVLQQLLQQARLGEDEVRVRLQNALAPTYWKTLNPSLSIEGGGERAVMQETPLDDQRQRELLEGLTDEGYFQTGAIVPPPTIARMREGVERLKKQHWPPVFAFVYDEFWQVARAPSLVRLLSEALGAGYRQVPRVWLHYVTPPAGASLWPPHFDGYRRGNRVTIWVPLTEATLDNGCIHVIPKNLTPGGIADAFARLERISVADVQALLQASRALPTPAGTALGWDFEVIHWGSHGSRSEAPRIACSQTFIAGQEAPAPDEVPLLDGHRRLPTFSQRLRTIAEAIRAYERFEVTMIRYLELAERLLARVGPGEGGGDHV